MSEPKRMKEEEGETIYGTELVTMVGGKKWEKHFSQHADYRKVSPDLFSGEIVIQWLDWSMTRTLVTHGVGRSQRGSYNETTLFSRLYPQSKDAMEMYNGRNGANDVDSHCSLSTTGLAVWKEYREKRMNLEVAEARDKFDLWMKEGPEREQRKAEEEERRKKERDEREARYRKEAKEEGIAKRKETVARRKAEAAAKE